jgi:iron complex transport system substrate-binding protein
VTWLVPRVVSLIASATEIVCALGCEEWLAGRSHECDYPPSIRRLPVCTEPLIDPSRPSGEIDRQVKATLRQALSVYRVHTDVLQDLQPDVVITQAQCEVCAVSLQDVERSLAGWLASRPHLVSLQPNALADVWGDIHHVAEALGVPERGAALVTDLQERIVAVAERARDLPDRPTVACVEWIDPLMAAGNWVPELVERAGGTNLFGEAGKHSPWMTWPELVARDPDIMRLRHRSLTRRVADLDPAARVAHPARRPGRARLPDRRQPVLQPTGAAPGRVTGDLRRAAPPRDVPLRPRGHGLGAGGGGRGHDANLVSGALSPYQS